MSSKQSHYEILGVSSDADETEIKKAYRKLSLKYHPDRNPNNKDNAVQNFQKINEAYETLSDVQKRKQYDMQLKFGMEDGDMGGINPEEIFRNFPFPGGMGSAFPFPFPGGGPGIRVHHVNMGNPGGFMGRGGGNGGGGRGGGGIEDIFEQLFMNMSPAMHAGGGGGERGNPNIQIFRNGQPMFGMDRQESSYMPAEKPSSIEKTIPITLENAYHGAQLDLSIERTVKENDMTFTENDTISVKIPAGVASGETIVIPDKGNTVNNQKGDIRLTFQIAKHDVFVRESDSSLDLQYETTIPLKDALCGFTVEIPHVCGKLLRVSNNTNWGVIHPGHRKEIPGLGMKRDNRTGKLTIIFKVDFPTELTKEQRETLSSVLA